MSQGLGRRDFLKVSAAALATAQFPFAAHSQEHVAGENSPGTPPATADSMILIWLPGEVSQVEYWDPKPFTPFEMGMKASEMLSPCESIPTVVDDVIIGVSGAEPVDADGPKNLFWIESEIKPIHIKRELLGDMFWAFFSSPEFQYIR